MKRINIYFHANDIYNLKDMSRLVTFPNKQKKTLFKYLKIIKQKYHIHFAVIDFHHPLREVLYFLFPQITIIMNPRNVTTMVRSHLGYDLDLKHQYIEEEIAATVENKKLLIQEVSLDVQAFYASNTKKEAIAYYEDWQSHVPIGVKRFHDVIRKIDFFDEEVFNYFTYRQVVDSINIKKHCC